MSRSLGTKVRQGDWLSSLLFDQMNDKPIEVSRPKQGFRSRNRNIDIICYGDAYSSPDLRGE